jgi:hypothetical protein
MSKRGWVLIAVILAIREVVIRRIEVQLHIEKRVVAIVKV